MDQFLKERLFEPLGMVDTDFYVPPAKANRLAALYGHPEGATELQLLEAPAKSSCLTRPAFLSGGGLVSTVSDYARFLQMLVNGGELDGAFNTYFWVDRTQALYGLLMTQHSPNNYYPLANTFKQLTYQALIA